MSNDDDRKQRSAAERRETEELLAGFDRPARTPRTPAAQRDFVDYFNDREASTAPRVASLPPSTSSDPRRAEPTFVVPREGRARVPSWLGWAALLLAMPLAGATVAFSVLGRPDAAPAPPPPPVAARPMSGPSVPSAATTISAATTPRATSAVPTAASTPSEAASVPAPARPTPPSSASGETRGDFIRNL